MRCTLPSPYAWLQSSLALLGAACGTAATAPPLPWEAGTADARAEDEAARASSEGGAMSPDPGDATNHGAGGPSLAGCTIFSADDPFRQDVSLAEVDPAWTSALFTNATKKSLHPDFGNSGAAVYGMPINVVPAGTAPVTVAFDYADESDPSPYPVPPPDVVKLEGGTATSCDGDCHLLIVEQETCLLYEAWACHYAGGWRCGSGAKFDLGRSSYGQRPPGHTSADAAGLAITPGLVRYREVADGVIRHALRFTMHCTQDGFVAPASHFAVPTGSGGCPAQRTAESLSDYHARLRALGYPPMGLRVRLKSSYPVAALPPEAKVIATAMKTYGMILADNGSDYYFQGEADPGWSDDLDVLKTIPGDAFEALATGTVTH
jgi:hypothetical protein